MAVAEGVVGQFDFGRVVKNTFQVIGSNLKELLVLSAPLSGLPALALGWAQVAYAGGEAPSAATGLATFGLGAVGFVVAVIGSALLQATIVRVAVSTLNGQSASAFAEMRKSIPFIAPLLGLGLLVGLGVMLGTMLLIVPGVILMIMWSVAAPAFVVERIGVFDSLSRSRNLTRGHRWRIFGLFVAYLAVYFAAALVLGGVAVAFSFAGGAGASAIASVVGDALASVIGGVISSAGAAAIYYELRAIKEGVGVNQLASVFD
ncbi:YciC family protein [Phenylobacterium sp.]|uniref:YciC family protein n=1 Tax=Phenylobacterium sp. TaxID=1871053 RepID=UPI0035B2FB2C